MTATARPTPLLTIVLGAGKGTRMKSSLPKVMHAIAGRSMLGHVLALARAAGSTSIAVVVGPGMPEVAAEAGRQAPGAQVFEQPNQRGTADAVLAARPAIEAHKGDVLVMFGDTPLLSEATLERLLSALDRGAVVAVLGFHAADPTGYGRLVVDATGALTAIREHNDASAAERAITLCNSGVMAFRLPDLAALLSRIGTANAKGEYYLTDAVEIARGEGHRCVAVAGSEEEMLGINNRAQLAGAEVIYQRRARERIMAEGATLIDPASVWLSHDTVIGRDVIIEPNVFFGPGVSVGDGVLICANSYMTGAAIEAGARIGPFARLRPGARIGVDAHVGNFVEVKNARLEAGAKANHLSYIGDGRVGPKANIGAGTIFCNYDGYNKHFTDVGAGAFVGSNSALVAPVRIGDGAYVGSGSVITRDVAPDALALERSAQEERPGWAAKFRALMQKRKAR
jgi:bifunctional UDP-N-acetylglucosamine pyrophosphorylase/glucosamine-1-phosphate N-acetyltransferase